MGAHHFSSFTMAGGRLTGVVYSAGKMAKTVVVEVSRLVRHSKYPRTLRRTSKHMAHDEAEVLRAGDKVRIVRSRPLSKSKHYVATEKVMKEDDVEIFRPLSTLFPDLNTAPPQIVTKKAAKAAAEAAWRAAMPSAQ